MSAVEPLRTVGTLNGISLMHTTLDDAVAALVKGVTDGAPAQPYRLLNAYNFALAETDSAYQSLLASAGVNLPDGRPLVATLNRLGRRGGQTFGQIRGPSFFVQCLDEGRVLGVRHFLLGGSPAVLDALKDAINLRFPGAQIVGMLSPPFRPLTSLELADQDAEIKASDADIVWVGLGTPKQDFEAQRICDALGVTAAGVGAAFDFAAGTKPEAPAWIQRLSLEWAFRLVSEPRRLWRRYLFGNTRFLMLVLREALRSH